MKTVNVGLIGAGTIGKGVAELLSMHGKLISKRTGVSVKLKSVCDKDKKALRAIKGSIDKSGDYRSLLEDKGIDIIVELIGGVNPAKKIVLTAIKSGKHVVTANKALLSDSWKDIFFEAKKNNVLVNFEASVGGGIPIIRAIEKSYVGNSVKLIYGILNGTTNFVLTKMGDEGCSFDSALKVAQERGIAEKDPYLDISGKDSAHKLAILALLGFGVPVSLDDIYIEGIKDITSGDIRLAGQWGYVIKLLAIAKKKDKGLQLRVHPTLIPEYHLLAGVKGEDNAVFVNGDFMGDSLLYGKGAGSRPTASSVVGDVVDIAEKVAYCGRECSVARPVALGTSKLKIEDHGALRIPYFLRFSVIDRPGVLSKISTILSKNNISIARMSQEERKKGKAVPVIMLTHKAIERDMQKAIKKIDEIDIVTAKTVVIRIEG